MNKKGTFVLIGELILWIPRLLILVLVLLSVVWILGSYTNRSFDTSDMEFYILTNRLFYSKNCFSYEGKSIINIDRFNKDILGNCIDFKNNIAVNLILSYKDKEIELIANEDLFKRGFYARDLKRSNYDYKTRKNYVLVFDANKIYSGLINIEAVFKK